MVAFQVMAFLTNFLFLVTTILIPLNAQAQGQDSVPGLLDQVDSATARLSGQKAACSTASTDLDPTWFGKAPPAWARQNDLCITTDFKRFCENAWSLLDQLPEKWIYPRDASGRVTGPGTLSDFWKARFASAGNKTKKQAAIRSYFNTTLANPEVVQTCCQGNSKCEKRLKSTSLEIGEGSTFPGEYDEKTRSVRVSTEHLTSYTYEEEIQGFVLHELGHACDEAMTFARVGDHNDPMQQYSRQNAKDRFSADFFACLERKSGASGFDGHSALEAFTEGIFFHHRKHPLHWLSCKASMAYNWPSECIFEVATAKAQICSK